MSLGLVLPSQGVLIFCGSTTMCVTHVDFDPRPAHITSLVDMVHYLCSLWGDNIGSRRRLKAPPTGADDALLC